MRHRTRFTISISLVALGLILNGCAAYSSDVKTNLMLEAGKFVACYAADDCDLKWNRAVNWIEENNVFPIKSQSANLIQTLGPGGYGDPRPYIQIERSIKSGGGYEFHIDAMCSNSVGCLPDRYALMISFNTFVDSGQRIDPMDILKQAKNRGSLTGVP